MKLIMNSKHLRTLQQVEDFVHGSTVLEPAITHQAERYAWIETALRRFGYTRLSRPDKGLMVAYPCRLTGYSR